LTPGGGPPLRVIEYSGCSYAHEPREFYLSDVHHVVKRVLRSRVEQREGEGQLTRSVWRVEDDSGRVFDLDYNWEADTWGVEEVRRAAPPPGR
jgi:hypothetical protein